VQDIVRFNYLLFIVGGREPRRAKERGNEKKDLPGGRLKREREGARVPFAPREWSLYCGGLQRGGPASFTHPPCPTRATRC